LEVKSLPYGKAQHPAAQPTARQKSRLHNPVLDERTVRIEIVAREIAEVVPVRMEGGRQWLTGPG
jgi:hypothetical protein